MTENLNVFFFENPNPNFLPGKKRTENELIDLLVHWFPADYAGLLQWRLSKQ
jgi:hypothetical protein